MAIKDETKDVLAKLLKNIEITNERFKKKIRKVEDVSQEVLPKTEANFLQITMKKDKVIHELEKKKERMMREYDEMMEQMRRRYDDMIGKAEYEREQMTREYVEMVKKAEDENNKLNEASRNDLTAMKDNMEFLNSIKQSIEEEEITFEDALNKLDTVTSVTENVKHLPRMKKYEYSEYVPRRGNLVGKLVQKEKFVLRRARELRGQGELFKHARPCCVVSDQDFSMHI